MNTAYHEEQETRERQGVDETQDAIPAESSEFEFLDEWNKHIEEF